MFKFSKSKLLITIGLSILIWVVTVVIQAINDAPRYVALFTKSECFATGYPISSCLKGTPEIFIYIINIFFWFLVINFIWGFFKHLKS